MKIISKYYDKFGKLRILKDSISKNDSIIRFIILKGGKEFPCCDFGGKCKNKAYAEVYPFLIKNSRKRGWNYLCKKHYFIEQRRLKWRLPASLKIEW